MSEKTGESNKKERLARLYRNFNALGALACFAAGAMLGGGAAVAMNALGAINLGQAAGGEVVRRTVSKKPKPKP
jgi:fatty acid desaturase